MQPDQIEEQKKKIQESEHNARKKEIELQFKNVFDEAKKILKREYYENEMSEKLRNLLEWIESDINKLSEKNDRDFVKKYKSFVETYRSGLVEFKEILLNLKKIEENRQEIKKVKINSFKQNPQSLNTEIKFSEKRLQRMRAGVNLIQVLEESLARKYQETMKKSLQDQPIQKEPQQQMDLSETEIQIFQELENGLKKERISQTNVDLDKDISKQKDIQIFDQVERALEEQKEKYQIIFKEFDKGFQKQKVKCESIVKSSYKPVKGDLDFTHKYQDTYFKNYFREKFKLANYFLGDQLIKLFLHENQKYVNKVLNKNSNSSQQNSFNEKKIYNKELDPKNFIQQDDLESNGKALQKILKINEEIQKELLQDEHQRNIEEMNKIEIQKKQEHWEKVLQQDDHRKSTPNLIKKASQVQLKKSQTVEKKTINIKPVISSLKKRTIYYQAHPNFPLISEVYKSHQNVPEERLKKAAIGYDIIQQPSRTLFTPPTNVNSQLENKNKVLKLEDDIYTSQQYYFNKFVNKIITTIPITAKFKSTSNSNVKFQRDILSQFSAWFISLKLLRLQITYNIMGRIVEQLLKNSFIFIIKIFIFYYILNVFLSHQQIITLSLFLTLSFIDKRKFQFGYYSNKIDQFWSLTKLFYFNILTPHLTLLSLTFQNFKILQGIFKIWSNNKVLRQILKQLLRQLIPLLVYFKFQLSSIVELFSMLFDYFLINKSRNPAFQLRNQNIFHSTLSINLKIVKYCYVK